MSYTSPIFHRLKDIHPPIADVTEQILRDVYKPFVKIAGKDPSSANKEESYMENSPYSVNMNTDNVQSSIYRFDDGYEIHIDVPGVKKEHINMDVDENFVIVLAERHLPDGNVKKYKHNYWMGIFEHDVDIDKISATHENGILRVHMPMKVKQFTKVCKRHIHIA